MYIMKRILLILFIVGVVLSGILLVDISGDGLPVYKDIQNGTNPLVEDTDGDGLTDYEEIVLFHTNPTVEDSDKDGLNDDEEINKYNTHPMKKDTDEDGLIDRIEINKTFTNPTREDTDYDGLNDYEEVNEYNTDPTKKDTDSDGLEDGTEIELGTNPTEADTSGDGLNDEFLHNHSELDPTKLNVLVEVDYNEQTTIPREMYILEDKFESAPVESNTGEDGINLVFIVDQSLHYSSGQYIEFDDYRENVYNESFGSKGRGSFHLFIAEQVHNNGNTRVAGVTDTDTDGMLVERRTGEQTTATIMHELGHQLGLYPDDYVGIDSRDKSWSEYPSVMNYNGCNDLVEYNFLEDTDNACGVDTIRFSEERGFNDWQHIEDSFPENKPDTSKLES